MIKLSEARQTEFLVGKPCWRAYLSKASSDEPLPVEGQTNCIASIDEDSSLLSLFPVEATGALRAASNHSLNRTASAGIVHVPLCPRTTARFCPGGAG